MLINEHVLTKKENVNNPWLDEMPEEEIKKASKKLNWGAFFFPTIWPFFHGLVFWGIILILVKILAEVMITFIPQSHQIYTRIFDIILGTIFLLKGNRLALSHRKYKSFEHFKDVEDDWRWWGLLIFLIAVGMGVLFGGIALLIYFFP